MLKASQIATIINECKDGVERSCAGEMFQKDKEGKIIMNNTFPRSVDDKIEVDNS